VAGVALGDIHLRFAWQAWHLGRHGTYGTGQARLVTGDAAVLCVAGVALGDIHLRFAWQACHLWHWAGSGGALGRAWSPVTPRYFGDIHLCVAGMALGDIHIRFAWQAWRLPRYGTGLALVARLGTFGRLVAGEQYFAWQAWHLLTSTFASHGRRGTW